MYITNFPSPSPLPRVLHSIFPFASERVFPSFPHSHSLGHQVKVHILPLRLDKSVLCYVCVTGQDSTEILPLCSLAEVISDLTRISSP